VLTSYDEDTGGILEFLGETTPMGYSKFMKQGTLKETVDLLNKKKKKAGTVTFSTEFVWMKPDPPLVPRDKDLNKKCKLLVKIIDATFLKDADLMGKQDPYIKWKYGRGEFQTTVKDDAGLYAKWDESFSLNGINRYLDQ